MFLSNGFVVKIRGSVRVNDSEDQRREFGSNSMKGQDKNLHGAIINI